MKAKDFWLYMFITSLLDEVNASNSALYIRCLRCKDLLIDFALICFDYFPNGVAPVARIHDFAQPRPFQILLRSN